MYEALVAVLDANNPIWEPVLAFSDLAKKVKSLITDIQALRQIQELDTKGITVNKTLVADNLIAATLKLIHAVSAYATVTDNYILLGEVNYTASHLSNARDTVLFDIATLIQSKAAPLETELAAYLIAPEDITGQQALIEQYSQALPEKRKAVVVSKTSTADLKLKFKEMDLLLNQKLDKLILIFQATNPDFVQQYFNARIIINLGHRTTTHKTLISGTVTDFDTDLPVDSAHVWVVETGQSFNTGSDGLFTIELASGGEYVLKVEKTGYQTHTQSAVKVNKGEEVTLEIELQPTV
jgi:hypothetical protein